MPVMVPGGGPMMVRNGAVQVYNCQLAVVVTIPHLILLPLCSMDNDQ
jgi:hypothetical protein